MARKRMVTRTIETTVATALCLDIETAEPSNATVRLSGKFKGTADMLNAVKRNIDTDTYKAVSIVDSYVETNLYGVPEEDFLKIATKIEPNTNKEINENEQEEN